MDRYPCLAAAPTTHNRAGCPYLNQTGEESVIGWPLVLAAIDIQTLPRELQAELLHLRGRVTESGNRAQV
jgi:hypothetical protein